MSSPKNNVEVVWVEGNHDEGLSKITSHFLGVKVYKEYKFTVAGNKILAIHGHQFDRFLNENVVISNIAAFIYEMIQKVGGERQTIARWIKGKSKGWLRLSKKISIRASEYAANRGFDTVVCGHTHDPMESYIESKNINFYNTGCWTDIPSSYIIISDTGKFTIMYDPA